jgi:hypothetical protein
VEARNRTRARSDYIHYDQDPAVNNRLYTARYKLGMYRTSVYERLGEVKPFHISLIDLSKTGEATKSGTGRKVRLAAVVCPLIYGLVH